MCRKKKRKYNESKLMEIEEKFQKREIRTFHQEVKKIEKGYQSQCTFIENEEGMLINEAEETMERWRNYCQELLNQWREG